MTFLCVSAITVRCSTLTNGAHIRQNAIEEHHQKMTFFRYIHTYIKTLKLHWIKKPNIMKLKNSLKNNISVTAKELALLSSIIHQIYNHYPLYKPQMNIFTFRLLGHSFLHRRRFHTLRLHCYSLLPWRCNPLHTDDPKKDVNLCKIM